MERAERLLDLVTLLLNVERPVPFREIRSQFEDYRSASDEAAQRKFERDKAELVDLGVPVEWVEPDPDQDEAGGYRVRPDAYFLPPLTLAPDELALLYVAGTAAHAMQGFPWPAEVARALEKIAFAAEESGARPAPLVQRLAVNPSPKGDPARVGAHFAALRDALARRKVVHLTYHGLYRDDVTERAVEPYGLFLRDGLWCLYAHCRLRGARRTFHLDRIERLEVSPSRPRRPDYDLPEDVDLAALARQRPWEYPIEAPMEVEIRIEPHLAFSARPLFGKAARIEALPDGAARVRVVSTHLDALVAQVVSLREAATLLAPEAARDRLVARLEAALRRAGGGAP